VNRGCLAVILGAAAIDALIVYGLIRLFS